MRKKAVVTGGKGFVGKHLVEALQKHGWQVIVFDKPKYDVRDMKSLVRIFKGVDCVFHLAALVSVEESFSQPVLYHEVNALGTLKVLEAMRIAAPRARLILASSASVYGEQKKLPITEEAIVNPSSPYALSKLMAERYCKTWSDLYGLKVVIIRPFNIYGPGMSEEGSYASAIGKFLKMRSEGNPLIMFGDGEQTRDYVHVRDVVEAYMRAATVGGLENAETYNVSSGKNVTMNSIAQMIGGSREYKPPRQEIRHSHGSIKRAKRLLKWRPKISLKDGIVELKKLHTIL
jgi:UDP-glucose 4-epimerase